MTTYKKIHICLIFRVLNGCGKRIRESLKKSLVKSIQNNSDDTILPILEYYPYYNESFPNSGITGFDLKIDIPMKINKASLLKKKAKCFYWFIRHFYNTETIMETLKHSLETEIIEQIRLQDPYGLALTLKKVSIFRLSD